MQNQSREQVWLEDRNFRGRGENRTSPIEQMKNIIQSFSEKQEKPFWVNIDPMGLNHKPC